MKTIKKMLPLLFAMCMLFALSPAAFAANYEGDVVVPGLDGIQPQDTLTLPDNTSWATLTARWGVRVTFLDWDETELQTEVIPVEENEPGSTAAPADPTRSGYTFLRWERYDNGTGTATLNDDGSVTDINAPGPIVFIAVYDKNADAGPDTPDNPAPGRVDPDTPAENPPADTPASPDKQASPGTGDPSFPVFVVGLLAAVSLLVAIVLFCISRKKKQN